MTTQPEHSVPEDRVKHPHLVAGVSAALGLVLVWVVARYSYGWLGIVLAIGAVIAACWNIRVNEIIVRQRLGLIDVRYWTCLALNAFSVAWAAAAVATVRTMITRVDAAAGGQPYYQKSDQYYSCLQSAMSSTECDAAYDGSGLPITETCKTASMRIRRCCASSPLSRSSSSCSSWLLR